MSMGRFDPEAAAESGVTPGKPVALHAFVAHETELTPSHRSHLDELARRIVHSLGGPLPAHRVLIVGHAATFGNISRKTYEERALARADNARAYLGARLAELGHDGDVEILTEQRANDVPLVDNMVHSTSQTARRNRALNRRVEIQLDNRVPGAHHSVIGPGVAVPPARLTSQDPLEELRENLVLPSILGSCAHDARERVPTDSSLTPYRWICAIEAIFEDPDAKGKLSALFGHAATGLMISPSHVLTAAHVLRSNITGSRGTTRFADAVYVRIVPGINGPPHTFPFGVVSVQFKKFVGLAVKPHVQGSFRVSEDWGPSEDPRADFALIKLPLVDGEPLGETPVGSGKLGWWGSPDFRPETVIKPMAKAKLEGLPINLIGYPLDKQVKATGKGKEKKFKVLTFPQWISSGKGRMQEYAEWVDDNFVLPGPEREKALRFTSGNFLTYDACTLSGNSGSPVWIKDGKDRLNLVAVHGRGLRIADLEPYEFGAGVRISKSVLETLREWERTM